MTERIVTNEDLQKALDWLRDNALDIGKAKAATIRTERMVQHVEALMFKASDATSSDKRRADARTSERWLEAVTEEALAAGEYEKLKALRTADELKIGAWRSEQATYRSMKL